MSIKTFKFKYLGGLIVVTAIIYGNKNKAPREIVLALDTGSTKTIIQPDNIELIGYSEREKTKTVGITTGSKIERGYELQISKLNCLDYSWNEPKIIVKKLPIALYYIDGLIGLDFFQSINKKIIINFKSNELQII